MLPRLLFRLTLRLYPRQFRRRFGDDMLAEFDARRAECGSRREVVLLYTRLVPDWITTSSKAHWHALFAWKSEPTDSKDQRNLLMSFDLIRNTRYAFRGMMRRPAPTLIAILALGLGIGLTAAMFSIVNGVVRKGFPVSDADRLVGIARINPSQNTNRLTGRIHDFYDMRERQNTLESFGAYQATAFNVSSAEGVPDFVNGLRTTVNTFDILRVPPILGRGFRAEDEVPGAAGVALIGYRFWHDRFGADPNIVGTTIRVDGRPTEVIGVMPEDFEFPFIHQLWLPLSDQDLSIPRGAGPSVQMFGRLQDGVSIEQAQADLSGIMAQLGQEYPDTNEGMTVVLGPIVHELIGFRIPPLLYTMLGAVSLVLIIACANVAHLLLARATAKGKELALKGALGASRARVITELLVDSAAIAAMGGVLGIGIAEVGIRGFNGAVNSLFAPGVPFWFSVRLDPAVLLFVLILTLGSSLLSGVLPALKMSRVDVQSTLKDGARGATPSRIGRLSGGLVVLEVAFSCALLVTTGLMVKSVRNVSMVDHPFETENVFTAAISLPDASYPGSEEKRQFIERVKAFLDADPDVTASSVSTELPYAGFGNGRVEIDGETYDGDRDYPSVRIGSIDDTYFRTVSSEMIQGRSFSSTDVGGSLPVAIVNSRFVQRFFPEEDPIGRRVALHAVSDAAGGDESGETWYTIVGVAPDYYLEGDSFILAPEAVYFPITQRPSSALVLMAQTRGDPLEITPRVREIVASIDPDLPISQVVTLDQSIANTTSFLNIFGGIFLVFGGAALFLACVGLYGVLSFTVNQRTQELGLRVALGATPKRVVNLVLRQVTIQLSIGVVLGLALSALLGQGLSFVLYDVSAIDMMVWAGVGALIVATGALAGFLPARRATRIDPMVAMQAG